MEHEVIIDRPANLQAVMLSGLGAMAWELTEAGWPEHAEMVMGWMETWPDLNEMLGEGGAQKFAERLKELLDLAEKQGPGRVYLG